MAKSLEDNVKEMFGGLILQNLTLQTQVGQLSEALTTVQAQLDSYHNANIKQPESPVQSGLRAVPKPDPQPSNP